MEKATDHNQECSFLRSNEQRKVSSIRPPTHGFKITQGQTRPAPTVDVFTVPWRRR